MQKAEEERCALSLAQTIEKLPSIYLLPELVPQHDGKTLLDKDRKIIPVNQEHNGYIVLAATSRAKARDLLGKAFYLPDETTLTGWVLKYGKPLCIVDSSNPDELHKIHPRLHWDDRYHGSEDYYDSESPKPILIVPLLGLKRTMGVLKIPATQDKVPFTATVEAIAIILAQIIAKTLEHTLLSHKIEHLIELGTKEDPREVFEAVTQSLYGILDCLTCQFYVNSNGGKLVRLEAENGNTVADEARIEYARGQDLVGWVFKTGKPLLIDDVRDYLTTRYLDDALLSCISDDPAIEDADRTLQHKSLRRNAYKRKRSFIAVPVKSRVGSSWGILCAYGPASHESPFDLPFKRSDLQLMHSFANTIALAIQNDRQRDLGLLLIKMGQIWEPDELYRLILEDLPGLVPGAECSTIISYELVCF